MTVAELKARMSNAEFLRWQQFYLQQPFDDLHRYHRPAAFLAKALRGGDLGADVKWLAGGISATPAPGEFSESDQATISALMGG